MTHLQKMDFPPLFHSHPHTFLAKPDRTKNGKEPSHAFFLANLNELATHFREARQLACTATLHRMARHAEPVPRAFWERLRVSNYGWASASVSAPWASLYAVSRTGPSGPGQLYQARPGNRGLFPKLKAPALAAIRFT
jgi:hypothetical protein